MARIDLKEWTNHGSAPAYDASNTARVWAEDLESLNNALEDGTAGINTEQVEIGGTTIIDSSRVWVPNTFTFGDGTSGDKTVAFDQGNANPPSIKWDQSAGIFKLIDEGGAAGDLGDLNLLNYAAATEKTISSGSISVDQSVHTVDTESDASSDDLTDVSGGTEGDWLILYAANSTRTVIVKHNVGNIQLANGSDYSMDDVFKPVLLYFDGTNWSGGPLGGGGVTNPLTQNLDFAGYDAQNVGAITNNIGSAQQQALYDGLVVPVAPGLGAADAIDPANTSTPIQDAIDACAATTRGFGVVVLPAGVIDSPGNIDIKNNVGLIGQGNKITKINITSSTNDGIRLGQAEMTRGGFIGAFTLRGPSTTASGHAIAFYDNVFGVRFLPMNIDRWGNSGVYCDPNSKPFEITFEHLLFNNVDPGNNDGYCINWAGGGAPVKFDYVAAYPDPSLGSNAATTVIHQVSGSLKFDIVNHGGGYRTLLAETGARTRIQFLNWEPAGQKATTGSVIETYAKYTQVDFVTVTLSTTDYVYKVTDNGSGNAANDVILGPVALNGTGATINNTVLNYNAAADNYCYLYGDSSDVTDTGSTGLSNLTLLSEAGSSSLESAVIAVRDSGNQTLSAGTWETIVFDGQKKDLNGDYDHTTGVFTAPSSGLYKVDANARFASPAAGEELLLELHINSSIANYATLYGAPAEGSAKETVGLSAIIELSSGDKVEVKGYRGNAGDIFGGSSQRNTGLYIYNLN